MLQGLIEAIRQFHRVFTKLPPGRRAAIAGALLLVAGGFVALLMYSSRADYQVLFSNLSQSDAAEVVAKLREKKIPYELAADGAAIKVPRRNLYETRLNLAGDGLPKGGGVGFELFNESKIGATEFVQRINYQRALQGELSRTINQFKEVAASRVHLVVPEETLFIREQRQPSAAVVLELKSSARLSPVQVKAIVNLVAGSVQGLSPDNVSVVDTSGRVLYDKKDEASVAGLSDSQTEFKRKVETDLVDKIQTLLDRVIGEGKTVAKVSTRINFNQEKTVEERFDPEATAIRSSQTSEEKQAGLGARAVGSPDEQFKVTTPPATAAGAGGAEKYTYDRTNETTNYEISKVNRQTIRPAGRLERLSVAVLIDGRYQEQTGPDGRTTRTYVPRTEEELQRFGSLVRSAVGFDQERGDVVQVTSMPFDTVVPTVVKPTILDLVRQFLSEYGQMLLTLLLILLFFLLVVRPLLRFSRRELREVAVQVPKLPPSPEEEMAGALEDLRKGRVGARERAALLAEKEPEMAMEVIRAWLHETPSPTTSGSRR